MSSYGIVDVWTQYISPNEPGKNPAGENVFRNYGMLDVFYNGTDADKMVAATDKGLCRIAFDEGLEDIHARFPQAEILPADAQFEALVGEVVALVDDPARSSAHLPLDARGTAFQQAVWQALRAIPAGETRTYSQIATATGRPQAVRAAGTACGDNALAVLIPCHRVLRSDGGLGGYAYGLERKKALLAREGAANAR